MYIVYRVLRKGVVEGKICEMKRTETVFLTESGGSLYLTEAMCITEKESEREMTEKKIVMIRMQKECHSINRCLLENRNSFVELQNHNLWVVVGCKFKA